MTNQNNFIDFDINDCDLFGGSNLNTTGAINNNNQLSNNFFDGNIGGYVANSNC